MSQEADAKKKKYIFEDKDLLLSPSLDCWTSFPDDCLIYQVAVAIREDANS